MDSYNDQKHAVLQREVDDRCDNSTKEKRFHVLFVNDNHPIVEVDMRSCCQWHAHEFIYFAVWNDIADMLVDAKFTKILVKEVA